MSVISENIFEETRHPQAFDSSYLLSVGPADRKEFTEVKASKGSKYKESPVFYLVEDLLTNKDPVLKNYLNLITDKSQYVERPAYYIAWDHRAVTSIYANEGYQCVDRHLSIDKYYFQNNHRMGLAHYTEVHKNPETKDVRIIHAFFSQQAKLIDIEASQLPKINFELNNALKVQIQNNSFEAQPLLSMLINMVSQGYIRAKSEASELEKVLSQQSRRFHTKKGKKEFLRTAEQFKKVLKEIERYNPNEYNAFYSLLLNLIRDVENTIKNKVKPINSGVVSSKPNDVSEPEPISTAFIESSQTDKEATTIIPNRKVEERKAYIEAIELLEMKLDKACQLVGLNYSQAELKNIVEVYKIAQELKEELLKQVFFSQGIPGFETQSVRIEKKFANIPPIEQLLEKYFTEGKVEEFKALFPYAKDKSNYTFCHTMVLRVVCEEQSEDILNARINICDFLYQSWDYYRLYIDFVGRHGLETKINASLLGLAILKQNSEVFSMLLRQGYNPDGLCATFEGNDISFLRYLIISCDKLDQKKFSEFFKLLLENGANPNSFIMNTGRNKHQDSKILKIIESLQIPKHLFEMAALKKNVKEENPYLDYMFRMPLFLLACETNCHPAILFLKKFSSLENVTVRISKFIFKSIVMLRTNALAVEHGLFCANSDEEANKLELRENQFVNVAIGPKQQKIQFILFPNSIQRQYSPQSQKENFETVKILFDIFKEKYQNLEEINLAINKLNVEIATLTSSQKNIEVARELLYQLQAKQLLIAQKGAFTSKDTKELIKCYYHILQLMPIIYFDNSNGLEMAMKGYAEMAQMIVKNSPFKNELAEFPAYQRICNWLNKNSISNNSNHTSNNTGITPAWDNQNNRIQANSSKNGIKKTKNKIN